MKNRRIGCLGFIIIILIISGIFNLLQGDKKEKKKENTKLEYTSPKKQDFRKEINPMMIIIGRHWKETSEILSKGTEIYNEDNTRKLTNSFKEIKRQWERYSDIPCTEENKELKEQIDTVKEKQLKAIDNLVDGIDNSNVNSINEATKLLNEANDIYNSVK